MGILDAAGVDVNDVPEDPFGFGKDYWPVEIVDVKPADISKSGKQYGTMIKWRCLDARFAYMESLGYGQWTQLPAPPAEANHLGWDKDSAEGKKVIFNFIALLKAFGIPADQWGKFDTPHFKGQKCLAKIFVKQSDEGFWEFRVVAHKEMPKEGSASGLEEFTKGLSTPAAQTGALSAMERAMQEEAERAKAKALQAEVDEV
jgi:hypothetical protein